MMRTVRLGSAVLLLAAGVHAETQAERGKRVVDEALAAMGGDRFLAMQDRVERGRFYSFYRERLSGLARAVVYTRYLTRPDPPQDAFFGLRERQVFGKKEDVAVVLTEDTGHEITFRGARPLPDEYMERFRESALRNALYILRMRLGERGLLIESRGSDVVDNQPVEAVEFADPDNRIVTVYFHHSTRLPVRQVTKRREPGKDYAIEELTTFSRYRDVGGGVMWPLTLVRTRDGEKVFEMFAESVEINQGLTDNLFMLPADLKILKK